MTAPTVHANMTLCVARLPEQLDGVVLAVFLLWWYINNRLSLMMKPFGSAAREMSHV